MPPSSPQAGPIAVYGATGYTGKLVSAELARVGAEFVIAGRSASKLDAVRAQLELDVPAVAAAIDDPASLRRLLADCAVVIDCAGPFVKLGEPVLAASVDAKTHYLDTTGEQPYIRMAFERYGPEAKRAGAAVVPAMGFDYAPGDMLASLTAEGREELDEVSLHYCWIGFRPSQGTARTTLEILGGADVEWTNGRFADAGGSVSRGTYEFPPPAGRQRMIRYPAGEQITVPRHISTRNVRAGMNAAAFSNERVAPIFAAIARPAGLAMRTPLKRFADAVISRLPEGPTPEQRKRMRWMIACEAIRGEVERKGVMSGTDVYGLTAASTVAGALLAASPGFEASGALAPAQAFEPKAFLAQLDRFDLSWEIAGSETSAPVEA